MAELGATYDSSPDADAEGRNLVEVRIPPEAVTLTNKQVRLPLDCAPLAVHVAFPESARFARAVEKANTVSMLLKKVRDGFGEGWVYP